MRTYFLYGLLAVLSFAALIGCQREPAPAGNAHPAHEHDDASIAANLAKLSPADRSLAEAQGYCANEPESKLGSMGVPLKLLIKDQPVFVCCSECSKHVLEHPQESLATAEKLRAKTRSSH